MLQEIIQQVEAAIQRHMTEKFGLSVEETNRSTDTFKDVLKDYFKFDLLNDPHLIQNTLEQLEQLQDPAFINHFRHQLATALEEKAGLSPEMAAKVRDFSVAELYQSILEEASKAARELDVQKILDNIQLDKLEHAAKEFFNSIGQRIAHK